MPTGPERRSFGPAAVAGVLFAGSVRRCDPFRSDGAGNGDTSMDGSADRDAVDRDVASDAVLASVFHDGFESSLSSCGAWAPTAVELTKDTTAPYAGMAGCMVC